MNHHTHFTVRLISCSLLLVAAVCLVVACGPTAADNGGKSGTDGNSGTTNFRLKAEPAGAAITVVDAKKAEDGADIVVEGRIQATQPRFHVFTMIDLSMPYCGEKDDETCKTPWDYCCFGKDEVSALLIPVRFVGADGKPVRAADGHKFAWRLLDRVKVVGKLRKLEDGTLVIAATGYWQVERPTIDWAVTWPEEVAIN